MPGNAVLLVDTFDTEEGIANAIADRSPDARARPEAGRHPPRFGRPRVPVRVRAREQLDAAGFEDTQIVASNDLDPATMESLQAQGARIDSWGVGTKLVTCYDQPALGGVYKLTAIRDAAMPAGTWRTPVKVSADTAKITVPGRLGGPALLRCRRHRPRGHDLGRAAGHRWLTGHRRSRSTPTTASPSTRRGRRARSWCRCSAAGERVYDLPTPRRGPRPRPPRAGHAPPGDPAPAAPALVSGRARMGPAHPTRGPDRGRARARGASGSRGNGRLTRRRPQTPGRVRPGRSPERRGPGSRRRRPARAPPRRPPRPAGTAIGDDPTPEREARDHAGEPDRQPRQRQPRSRVVNPTRRYEVLGPGRAEPARLEADRQLLHPLDGAGEHRHERGDHGRRTRSRASRAIAARRARSRPRAGARAPAGGSGRSSG